MNTYWLKQQSKGCTARLGKLHACCRGLLLKPAVPDLERINFRLQKTSVNVDDNFVKRSLCQLVRRTRLTGTVSVIFVSQSGRDVRLTALLINNHASANAWSVIRYSVDAQICLMCAGWLWVVKTTRANITWPRSTCHLCHSVLVFPPHRPVGTNRLIFINGL